MTDDELYADHAKLIRTLNQAQSAARVLGAAVIFACLCMTAGAAMQEHAITTSPGQVGASLAMLGLLGAVIIGWAKPTTIDLDGDVGITTSALRRGAEFVAGALLATAGCTVALILAVETSR